MDKIWKLVDRLAPLVSQWCAIHYKYNKWNNYGYEMIWNNIIKVTLKSRIVNNKWEVLQEFKQAVLNRVFRNLIKQLNAETINPPITDELWYDDSLRWLYYHYPYGETNNSNCVLVWSAWRIIAMQYNWLNRTSIIHSNWVHNIPDYIVINNKKKLQWSFNIKQLNEIEKILKQMKEKNIL